MMIGGNKHAGVVLVEIDGQARRLRYGWAQIGALQDQLGAEFTMRIATALTTHDLKTIAIVLVIGLQRDWPEVTVEAIYSASPPILIASQALEAALNASFNGAKGVPDDPVSRPTLASRIRSALTLFSTLLKPRSSPV